MRGELRNPAIFARIRRRTKVMAERPEEAAITDWIEAAYDWDDWR
jgi:hypothetical protein